MASAHDSGHAPFFASLPPADLLPLEEALRQALLNWLQHKPGPFPLGEWIDRRIGGEVETRRDPWGFVEILLRGSAPPVAPTKGAPPQSGGSVESFFAKLPKDGFKAKEQTLRDAIFQFLATWDLPEPATIEQLGGYAAVQKARSDLLPWEVRLEDWIERRIGGEIVLQKGPAGQLIVDVTPDARGYVLEWQDRLKGAQGVKGWIDRDQGKYGFIKREPAAEDWCTGSVEKCNETYGFIREDGSGESRFVMPGACLAFGSDGVGALPPPGTRVAYKVVTDAKTGRLRAENVLPEDQDGPRPQEISVTGWIDQDKDTFGFIKRDDGGADQFFLPVSCVGFGKTIPPVNTRVRFSVVTDAKTGKTRADDIVPCGPAAEGRTGGPAARKPPWAEPAVIEDAALHADLVRQVKRASAEGAMGIWNKHCDDYGNGTRDPKSHSEAFLQDFLDNLESGTGDGEMHEGEGPPPDDVDPEMDSWLEALPSDSFLPEEDDLRDAILGFLEGWKGTPTKTSLMAAFEHPSVVAAREAALPGGGNALGLGVWIERRIGGEVDMHIDASGREMLRLRQPEEPEEPPQEAIGGRKRRRKA